VPIPTNLPCWICNKPVRITDCKFDEWGNPVHEECSVARIALRIASDNPTVQEQTKYSKDNERHLKNLLVRLEEKHPPQQEPRGDAKNGQAA